MPLPSPSNFKESDFRDRYYNTYTDDNTYELVRTALKDLSDDPNYAPFDYDDIPEDLYFSQDETQLYSTLNEHFKKDRTLSGYLNEFTEGPKDEPYFTDKESYKSFMDRFYDFLCEKIWYLLRQKADPKSSDFASDYVHINAEPVNLRTEADEKELDDTMDAVSGLVNENRLTLPEGVSLENVREKIKSLQECDGYDKNVFGPAFMGVNRQDRNRRRFTETLRELDTILAPGLTKGENAIFDEAYYKVGSLNMDKVLAERLEAIRDFSKTAPEEGNFEKMMEERFTLSESTVEFRDKAFYKLISCREELLASDHFFQKSSQEFKEMQNALDAAISIIGNIKKADLNKFEDKAALKSIRSELRDVSWKVNAYLVYKEDGPTGLFGASRVAAAKNLRDAIRSLLPATKESKILSDCKDNIKDMFGESRADNPKKDDFNLSKASREIAGYIAPYSGMNLNRVKAAYMFNEDFEKEYALAKSNRIDLVLDYLKHPDEAYTLSHRIVSRKDNYERVRNASSEAFLDTNNDLGYRYVGTSYAIKGLTDKMMEQKAPDVDTVLLGELTKTLNEDIKAIKDVKLDPSFKTQIYENTKYAKAAIATSGFLKRAMALEEKANLIGSLKGNPRAKEEYSKQEYKDLMTIPAGDVELNTMLGYSLLKTIAGKGGMQAVLNLVTTWQANDPNWTWDKMADGLRERNSDLAESFNKLIYQEEHEERKEVDKTTYIFGGPGHIMRNSAKIMGKFENYFKAKANEAAKENVKKADEISKKAKPSRPQMK